MNPESTVHDARARHGGAHAITRTTWREALAFGLGELHVASACFYMLPSCAAGYFRNRQGPTQSRLARHILELGRWIFLQRMQRDSGGMKSSTNWGGERWESCTAPSTRRLTALSPSRAYPLPRTRRWRGANTGSGSCARLRRPGAFPTPAS